jgi:hypothetical protein
VAQEIISCSKNDFRTKLQKSIRRNATVVKMTTTNGPATATDAVDIEILVLEAHARVLLLTGCPAIFSLGRLVGGS